VFFIVASRRWFECTDERAAEAMIANQFIKMASIIKLSEYTNEENFL
jgi:hypothetical protein